MNTLNNLDLFSVGLAIAGVGILGFVVFFNNRRSITNETFLLFSLTTLIWGVVNYLSYQITVPYLGFWLLRLTIFLAVWQAFTLFRLLYVFPREVVGFPSLYKFVLVPIVILTAVITLTPLVFLKIGDVSPGGRIDSVINGPGIFLFAVVSVGLVIGGIVLLLKRIIKARGIEKRQFSSVFVGIFITFILIIIFNFILPAFFNNPRFTPLGAVFIFPFVVFTAYAIIKHHLLNIKVIATEMLTFILSIVTLVEVVISQNVLELIFRVSVFVLVLSFGILLIRSVRREVEQREKLEKLSKDLGAANEKLKELDKLKSEFLSFASHQIKSPMAVVKGFAQLIYDGSYGQIPDKVKETVARIKEAIDRLLALVNNFLDLRRIEEGRMEYNFESVNVVELVKKIADDLGLLAKQKNLDFSFETQEEALSSKVDVQRFSQVIQNLIDNAIKYTEKGFVRVSVAKQNQNEVLISVSDSGRGMPKEFQANLFQQFTRETAAAKEKQGTGLGLFIAKQIVLAHKGDIWVESEGAGKGSRFLVKIPLENS